MNYVKIAAHKIYAIRSDARSVSLKTLHGGQFTLSTQLIIPSTVVSLYHLYSFVIKIL